MAFSVKDWQDYPNTSTPLSAAALEDLETRLSAWSDSTLFGRKIALGSTSVALTSATGHSQGTTGNIAHGLGTTPTYVIATASTVANQEGTNGGVSVAWVGLGSKDGTNIVLRAEIAGTTNNSVTINWLAIA